MFWVGLCPSREKKTKKKRSWFNVLSGPVSVSWKENEEEAELIQCSEWACVRLVKRKRRRSGADSMLWVGLCPSREKKTKKRRSWFNALSGPVSVSWKENEEEAELIQCFEWACVRLVKRKRRRSGADSMLWVGLCPSREKKTKKRRSWFNVLSGPVSVSWKEN